MISERIEFVCSTIRVVDAFLNHVRTQSPHQLFTLVFLSYVRLHENTDFATYWSASFLLLQNWLLKVKHD
jgi:hypothetical protein